MSITFQTPALTESAWIYFIFIKLYAKVNDIFREDFTTNDYVIVTIHIKTLILQGVRQHNWHAFS